MNFLITLINDEGFLIEESLRLPISQEATWDDFMAMRSVRDLLLMNPTMTVIDVTPEGMPAWFTDEQQLTRQLQNMGIKKSQNERGQSVYTDDEDSQ